MREQPHASIESEQAILGAMMIEPRCIDSVKARLSEADFYRETHQWLFEAVCSLRDGHPDYDRLDQFMLRDELERRERNPETWSAVAYCSACIDAGVLAYNLDHHIRVVKEKSNLRRQAAIVTQLSVMLRKRSADPTSIRTWLSEQIDTLNQDAADGLVEIGTLLLGHCEMLAMRKEQAGLPGFTTGFSHLDNVTGGYGRNCFVLLKAPRGSGKTHHAIQAITNCCRAGKGAAFFSLDTPKRIILNRFIAHISGLNSFRLNLPREEDWNAMVDAMNTLWQWPLYICDRSSTTARDIQSQCKALAACGLDLGLVVIDYAEVVITDARPSREQELTQVSIILRDLCRDLDTTVMLLSQVNDEGQERYSRSLGNNCDVLLAWRKERKEETGRLTVEKCREGSTTAFDCECDFGTSRIRETELDHSEPAFPPAWPWWFDPTPLDFRENPNPYSLPGERTTR